MDKEIETYVDKVSGLLIGEFLEDVDLRYDYISELGRQKIDKILSSSIEEKNKLYDGVTNIFAGRQKCSFEMAEHIYGMQILQKFYTAQNNKEKCNELTTKSNELVMAYKNMGKPDEDINKKQELENWIKVEQKKLAPTELAQARDNFFIPLTILFENQPAMHKIFDAQINRTHEFKSEEEFGYCLRAITSSLYKQQALYGAFDFMPSNIEDSIRNTHFVQHLSDNFPDAVFRTDPNNTTGDIIEKNNIKPGAIVSIVRGGIPAHAMLYTHKDAEGKHLMMGFNNEMKDANLSFSKDGTARESFVIDVEKLIKNSLINSTKDMSKTDTIRYLNKMEDKLKTSISQKNFQNVLTEGKTLSPEKQWNGYYQRSDVKFDVKTHIETMKNQLKSRRTTSQGKAETNRLDSILPHTKINHQHNSACR